MLRRTGPDPSGCATSSQHPIPRPHGALTVANELFWLLPSCLMTLAPVTPPSGARLTRTQVEDVLAQCGAHFEVIPPAEVESQLAIAASDLKGHVEYAYVGLVENYAPFAIAGSDFAFISVIGCVDDTTAHRAGERMAHHERTTTSSRGFVCANVIVQRMVRGDMNPDKLDRFLLERFASAASRSA
jgi:hypothetical protein